MPKTEVKKVVCLKCGKTTEVKLSTSINAAEDLNMRRELLSGRLFSFKCSACGYTGKLFYPVLYNDPKNKFMVYLIPDVDRFQIADKDIEKDFDGGVDNVRKRIVPDFNSFLEKIYIFECGLDDMAVEITKLAISNAVAKKFNLEKVEDGYLSMYDRESNTMGFTFFVGEDREPYIQSVRLEIYGKSMKITEEFAAKDRKLKGFLKIDREWSENILYRYKQSKNNN